MANLRKNHDVYYPSLEKVVDELFEQAKRNGWTWSQLAKESGLSYSTVKKLGYYETTYPEYRTIQLLASAVGGYVEFSTTKQRSHKITWEPSVFDGRAA